MAKHVCGSLGASARPSPSGGGEVTRRASQRGQGTVEYGLLVAAGALFVIVGMLFLAGGVEGLFERAGLHMRRPRGHRCHT